MNEHYDIRKAREFITFFSFIKAYDHVVETILESHINLADGHVANGLETGARQLTKCEVGRHVE